MSWPQDRVGLGLTLWPPWPHGAVGWTGEGAGPGDWGRGAAAQAGSVEVSAKDGGQEYRYILPEARGSNRLLHTLAYR